VTAPQRRFQPRRWSREGSSPSKRYCGRVRQPSSLKAPATVTRGRGFKGWHAGGAAVSKITLWVWSGGRPPGRISLPVERGTTSARRSSTGCSVTISGGASVPVDQPAGSFIPA